jgi:hypothetical protein
MVVELASREASDGLRTALRSHLSAGPLQTLSAALLDAATDAVVAVIEGVDRPRTDDSLLALVRNFHDDARLAASRYASGDRVADRAHAARIRIRRVVAERFGDSDAERLMRAALEQGYLEPLGGHASAERHLHLSRSTYFRVLGRARARLLD